MCAFVASTHTHSLQPENQSGDISLVRPISVAEAQTAGVADLLQYYVRGKYKAAGVVVVHVCEEMLDSVLRKLDAYDLQSSKRKGGYEEVGALQVRGKSVLHTDVTLTHLVAVQA